MMAIKVHSFDVFDTCITRPFLSPIDLFYDVALLLRDVAPASWSPDEFVAARVRAEQAARQRHALREDIRFDDIFEEFAELTPWQIATATARNAELAAERNCSIAIASTIARIHDLHAHGERVIFISDMYLPGDFILELLRGHGVDCARSSVYVSGDIGLTKGSGRLFEHVLAAERLASHELIHVGDHRRNDWRVPRRLGIQAKRYVESLPNRYERNKETCVAFCSDYNHSAISGLSRGARLVTSGDATIARLAANVIGPFLTAFVAWVLADARARGLETLYFVSRDGQIFLRIAQALGGDMPRCRYLYGSRQAWFLPAVTNLDATALEWAWTRGMAVTPRDILRRLELTDDATRAVFAGHGYCEEYLDKELNSTALSAFIDILLSEPLASTIEQRARLTRVDLTAYLAQEGLLASPTAAIVDVGWTLKCQRALNEVINLAGGTPVHGYYLGVISGHVPLAERGRCIPFVSPTVGDLDSPLRGDWFFKLTTMLLLEHLFTVADHPSASGYQRGATGMEPTFKAEHRDPKVLEFAHQMQTAIVDYARRVAASPHVDPTSRVYRERAFTAARKFATGPEAADVRGVAWLPTNKDQSHDPRHQARLADSLNWLDLVRMVRYEFGPGHAAFFAPNFAWLAGSAALSPAPIRWLYHALTGVRRLKLQATR